MVEGARMTTLAETMLRKRDRDNYRLREQAKEQEEKLKEIEPSSGARARKIEEQAKQLEYQTSVIVANTEKINQMSVDLGTAMSEKEKLQVELEQVKKDSEDLLKLAHQEQEKMKIDAEWSLFRAKAALVDEFAVHLQYLRGYIRENEAVDDVSLELSQAVGTRKTLKYLMGRDGLQVPQSTLDELKAKKKELKAVIADLPLRDLEDDYVDKVLDQMRPLPPTSGDHGSNQAIISPGRARSLRQEGESQGNREEGEVEPPAGV